MLTYLRQLFHDIFAIHDFSLQRVEGMKSFRARCRCGVYMRAPR
jgi:hypothetical protein